MMKTQLVTINQKTIRVKAVEVDEEKNVTFYGDLEKETFKDIYHEEAKKYY